MKNGQFQIYTGNGKGKTTAAIGLAVRAAGAGLRVYIGQFIKDMEYSEIKILRKIPNITVELYGTGNGCLIDREYEKKDTEYAIMGAEKIIKAMNSGEYDVVIAEEINVAYLIKVLPVEEMRRIAENRPENCELVFTGIGAPYEIIKMADLVSEVREIKHYYKDKGLTSRDGIER